MPKTLILVRHGETDLNVGDEPRIRGRIPAPLNQDGNRHADQAGKFLRDEKIDIIYYSPILRAEETAEAISKYHPNAKFAEEPLATDISWGDWEGKTYLEAFGVKDGGDFFEHPEKLSVPNGEQLLECMSRVEQLLFKIQQGPEDVVCVVSHGTNLNLLACLVFESPLRNMWAFYMAACGVSKLAMHDTGKYTIKYWNHYQHLE